MNPAPRSTYQQGDHVCTLYTSREEQLAAAIEYIRGGISRGERCLYICCDNTPGQFRKELHKAGIDTEGELRRGALILLTRHDGHLKGGSFDPRRMVDALRQAVGDALRDGFKGLCAAGDMSWVLDGARGTEKLREYEAMLNDFFPTERALGLCQYNRRTFPDRFLEDCLATHPHVRVDGPLLMTNPFYGVSERQLRTGEKLKHLRVNAA